MRPGGSLANFTRYSSSSIVGNSQVAYPRPRCPVLSMNCLTIDMLGPRGKVVKGKDEEKTRRAGL